MLKKLIAPLLLAASLSGCPLPYVNACSSQALAADVAACVAREQTECRPTADGKKDTSCPAYLECRETIAQWEGCQ